MGTIEHDKESCIGCGACIATNPKGWKMGNDGKANLIDNTTREDGWEEKTVDETNFKLHKEAAENCPANCIHLTNKKGEKIL